MSKPPKPGAGNVVNLFTEPDDQIEEMPVGREKQAATRMELASPKAAIDLSDKPKCIMTIGPGNVGKTTLMRWLAERGQDRGSTFLVGAVDPDKRGLEDYVENVQIPDTTDPAGAARWVKRFLNYIMNSKRTALIDYGGGDTSLGRIVEDMPDLLA